MRSKNDTPEYALMDNGGTWEISPRLLAEMFELLMAQI